MGQASESVPQEIPERRVIKGGLTVAAGLMVAQVTGYVRQAAIGYLLGTGPGADALSVAMGPIEMWWSVLALAVIFGFVPMLTPEAPGGPHAFREILKPVARLSVASSIGFFLLAEFLVRAFAPGLDAPTAAQAATLLRILSLAPAAVGVSFLYSALLMSRRRFAVPSLHHAAVNFMTVAVAALLFSHWGAAAFAAGYSLGAWLQLGWAHLYSRHMIRTTLGRPDRIGLGELLSGPAPVLAQAASLELNTAVSRAFASTFGPGMTASFEFAAKLFRVPLALAVVPLSQSLLPEVSSRRSEPGQRRSAVHTVYRAAWLIGLAAIAVMGVMMLLGRPIVSLVFERGVFSAASTQAVSTVLLGYMPVILGRGLFDFLSRMFFGMGRHRMPVIAGWLSLAANIVVCMLLPSENPVWIGAGAVLGFSIAAALTLWQFRQMRKDV